MGANLAEANGKLAFLSGDGELGALIRGHDWKKSPLGWPADWPDSLKTLISVILCSAQPMFIAWGDERAMIYNDSYAELLRNRHPDALGRPLREVWWDIIEDIGPTVDRAMAGTSTHMEDVALEVTDASGLRQERHFSFSYTPVRDAGGTVLGMFCACQEISARIEAERQVAEARARESASEIRLQTVLDSVTDVFYAVDIDWNLIVCNRAAEKHFGINADATIGSCFLTALGHPDYDREYLLNLYRRAAEAPLVAPSIVNRGKTVDFRAAPLPDGGWAVSFTDITDHKEADRALAARSRELEELNATLESRIAEAVAERSIFASIVEESEAYVQVASPDFTYLAVNKASARQFKRMFGVEPKPGDNFLDVLAKWPEHQEHARSLWSRAFAGESFREVRDFAIGGRERRYYESRYSPLHDGNGKIVAAYQFVTEITDRVRNEARLRTIFDTSFQFQGLAAVDGTLLEANKSSLDAIACEPGDVIGIKVWDTPWFSGVEGLPARVKQAVEYVIATKTSHMRETTLNLLGKERVFNISMRPMIGETGDVVGLITEANEITALRAAEAALLQTQKLEGMGQLTGGVAHDFNNLLTPILGALDLLQRRGVGNDLERSLIEGAMQSAERARTLVQRLLAFARRQPLRATAVDISKLVEGMADLISRTTGPQVRVVTEIGAELPSAMADANQLELAILNLAVNARDAMPNGGTLRISATEARLETLENGKVQPGRYVCLSVADDGQGMDEATQARAIEPFFSTKGIGQGTGLGLSMAHGLASQLGGALTIDSHPGVGTNIGLWLPATERAVEEEATTSEPVAQQVQGLALLVDDEPLVRASTAEMLGEIGFEVVQADSGEAAMKALKDGLAPDLLVTDHLMPGMDGTQLAHAAAEMRPGLKVLMVSGYAERGGIDPSLARLAKPFRSADLMQALTALGATEQKQGYRH